MKLDKAHKRYPVHSWNNAPNSWWYPANHSEWEKCPRCGLRPKIRVTNSMRRACCGCWRSEGDRWQIAAESRASYVTRMGSDTGHDKDALRKNWNIYCTTGQIRFKLGGSRYGWIFRSLFGLSKKRG